ncbi:MAG: AAA family ATPase [Cyanobacteria bacterium P01_G01_bin.54]
MMLNLTGYREIETRHSGPRTLVYRALRLSDNQPVIIKVLRNPQPPLNELVQFRNQFIITQNLDSPFIVKPLALERYENSYALVMPDEGAVSLQDYWQGQAGAVSTFLPIAIQLAQALDALNQQRIIHKDIKPANILIQPETGNVKLTDFCISTLLPKETQHLQPPNQLEGTLAYISPEQTGRMNRGIDYRSDFYSLGVTFYELLTGQLPFTSQDRLELVHSHLARTPPLARLSSQFAIPEVLVSILQKLMAKNAEDRYQSALGLKYDLETCQRQWQANGTIVPFPLGKRDQSDRFLIPEKLYGRQKEVQALLAAFERVTTGKSEMMLVAGFSGIGKTAVINEVHKPITNKQGYFISGKFDQFNRDIPLNAFVQAFRNLMKQLLGETNTILHQWKMKILAVVGENGRVLIDVIPELEMIIGSQPPVLELSGNAAQNRFNLLLKKFVEAIATPQHPLVLFLDDLQWADSASLHLIKVLMGDRETHALLLLGAYRDNEVFPTHPLIVTLGELEKRCDPKERSAVQAEPKPRRDTTRISTLTLKPLSIDDVNSLVAGTLRCETKFVSPLTELIYQKTRGNPFFTIQFLRGLHQDQHITFDRQIGNWQWDLAQLRDATLIADVVAFIAKRLQTLPQSTQDVLKFAACIGNQFDLETLATVCETTAEAVAVNLWSALQEELIVPISEAYKFFQGELDASPTEIVTVRYRFLHDRVQQAAYSLIETTQKQATHLKIGQLLLQRSNNRDGDDNLFNIVNHLNFGRKLASQTDELSNRQLAQLNLQAARKAKRSTAYSAAVGYTTIGLEQLTEESWEQDYPLTLELHNEAVEAHHLCTHFEQAEELAQVVLQKAHTLLDKIKVYILQTEALIAHNQLRESVDQTLKICAALGYPLTLNPEDGQTIAPLPALEALDQFPEMTDPAQLATLQLLVLATGPAYMSGHAAFAPITRKMVNLSLDYGHSALASYAYGIYGLVLSANPEQIEDGYHAALLARQLLEDYEAKELTCKIGNLVNIPRHLKEPVRNSFNHQGLDFTNAIDRGFEMGDIVYAGYCGLWVGVCLVFVGEPLTEVELKQAYYAALMRNNKLDYSYIPIEIWRQLALNLQGRAADILVLTGESYDESQIEALKTANPMVYFFACLAKLTLHYLLHDYETAMGYAEKAMAYEAAAPASVPQTHYRFYETLTRLAVYAPDAPLTEQVTCLERVVVNLELMERWAQTAPMNYQHKYELMLAQTLACLAQHEGVAALYEQIRVIRWAQERGYAPETGVAAPAPGADRLQWQYEAVRTWANRQDHSPPRQSHPQTTADYHLAALTHYEQAIIEAHDQGLIQDEALANELAATFYLNRGSKKIAYVYLKDAYYCYSHWGAMAKVQQLEATYPQLLRSQATSAVTRDFSNPRESTHSTLSDLGSNLDMATLMRASRSITREIILSQLLTQLIKVLLENTGAQAGFLLLASQGELRIEAAAEANGEIEVMQSMPLEFVQPDGSLPLLSSAIVNYVVHTHESVVLNDACHEGRFTHEAYLQDFQVKSVLCVPLLNRGQLRGVVYLENNLAIDAFTTERVEIVQFLSGQAAIAIHNAQLYSQLQDSERQLKQFLEAIPIGIGILDANGRPYYTNQKAEEILGKGVLPEINAEEITDAYRIYIAKTDRIYPPEQLPIVQALQGKVCRRDNLEIRRDNVAIPVESVGAPVYNERGEIVYAMTAFQDISERKQAEKLFIEYNKSLEDQLSLSLENTLLYEASKRFIPAEFLSFLEKDSIVDVQLGDQVEREMTVLFSDIRNFTTLSEQMTPAENFAFINEYLGHMEPKIQKYGGFIDKYIGDAIMALFPNSPDDAVQAAIAMLQGLNAYNQLRKRRQLNLLRIGIGLHTGTLMLGTVGGTNRMDGTVIGDSVNLCSRVEGLTKTYGVALLTTQKTILALNDAWKYDFRFLEKVYAKGKAKAISLFEIFSADLTDLRSAKIATKSAFEQGAFLYGRGEFQTALRLFQDCVDCHEGDRPARHYLQRCQQKLTG